jgi:hypothetical protein
VIRKTRFPNIFFKKNYSSANLKQKIYIYNYLTEEKNRIREHNTWLFFFPKPLQKSFPLCRAVEDVEAFLNAELFHQIRFQVGKSVTASIKEHINRIVGARQERKRITSKLNGKEMTSKRNNLNHASDSNMDGADSNITLRKLEERILLLSISNNR